MNEESCFNSGEGFILDMWCNIFGHLGRISVFNIVRFIAKKMFNKRITYTFVDVWVLGNLFASILLSYIVYKLTSANYILIYIIFTYGALRVFEVIIYQLNVLLFDPYRAEKRGKNYAVRSIRRIVVLLLHNYVEIMFWYSAMIISIVVLSNGSANSLPWSQYIKANVLCIATLDMNSVADISEEAINILSNIAFWEVVSGIIMTIISLARFIGILPPVSEINTEGK